ncbi:hypothetical protein SAMN06265173_103213 [Thalassovita litoralis]|jgi:hypothetical protein|uniref:Uncharacterized protein n=1 Tax=Thalassovita litoralis TaxID=1010611 RepID=A0A521BNU0_9RHOB|nr:hypothetical protein SAMN06265173_103213 [Thalassovita litoralis]
MTPFSHGDDHMRDAITTEAAAHTLAKHIIREFE